MKLQITALAASLLMASAAHADVESGKLVLSGFTDTLVGHELAAGNYEAVIQKLAPHAAEFNTDEVAASTNLCVAYVATGRLDEAHDACEEAVRVARLDQAGVTLLDHLAHQDAVAIAYANLAVLNKLSAE